MNRTIRICRPRSINFAIMNIIEFEVLFILMERLLEQLGAPHAIIYILDVLNIVLFLFAIQKKKWMRFIGYVLIYVGMVVPSCVNAIFNYSAWGGNLGFTFLELRNIIRFPMFFIICVSFLDIESCERIYRILVKVFFINFFVILYQYFTVHPSGAYSYMRGDLLNGIFGTTAGGNIFVNVLMVIVIAYLINSWSDGKTSTSTFVVAVLISLVIAALIELKAFFIEFAIMYLFYLIKKKKSKKEIRYNIVIIFLALVVSNIGLEIIFIQYPWFREQMTISGMVKAVTDQRGYTLSGDLNRFSGVFTIAKQFFNGDPLLILLGLGIGNGSASVFGNQTTLFYRIYEYSHYNWFSGTYMFTQCGAIGLILYLASFVYLFVKRKESHRFKLISQIMCLMAMFLIFYGEALKTDIGYLVIFSIASGFIKHEKTIKA